MSDSLFIFGSEQCEELALSAYAQFLAQAPVRAKHVEWTEEAARNYYISYFEAFGPGGRGEADIHFAQSMLEDAYGRHAAKLLLEDLDPIAEHVLAENLETPVRINAQHHVEESWESSMRRESYPTHRSNARHR